MFAKTYLIRNKKFLKYLSRKQFCGQKLDYNILEKYFLEVREFFIFSATCLGENELKNKSYKKITFSLKNLVN